MKTYVSHTDFKDNKLLQKCEIKFHQNLVILSIKVRDNFPYEIQFYIICKTSFINYFCK